jgi:hypothetical protein
MTRHALLDDLLGFALSLWVWVSRVVDKGAWVQPTSSSVWIPAEFCADWKQMLAYGLVARSRRTPGKDTMVKCELCDDRSRDAVVVGYRWMLMVTAKSWGPSAPFDMRLALAPSRKVASPSCRCLSIATSNFHNVDKSEIDPGCYFAWCNRHHCLCAPWPEG